MQLKTLDWAVVTAYFLFNLGVGFYYKARAGKSTGEFFLGGRNVPWWLAGTSMVATTFAADTPLAVTGMVVALIIDIFPARKRRAVEAAA